MQDFAHEVGICLDSLRLKEVDDLEIEARAEVFGAALGRFIDWLGQVLYNELQIRGFTGNFMTDMAISYIKSAKYSR